MTTTDATRSMTVVKRSQVAGRFNFPALILLTAAVAAGGELTMSVAAQTPTSLGRTDARAAQSSRLVAEGVAALEQNNAAAEGLFQQALALNPNEVTAHTYLGILADRANNLPEAERHFAAAARLAPASPSTLNNYGAVLLKLNRLKLAAAQFEASLRLEKNQPSALINLAQIHFSGGTPADLQTAREMFEQADKLSPDVDVARALIVIALRLNEREAAAKYFQTYAEHLAGASGRTPDAAARTELGGALFEAKLFKEAVTELGAASVADPANTDTVIRLAKAYLAQGDIPAAGRTLEAAVARGADAAPVYALLASVYEQSGHIENAIPAMRLAVGRDPQSEIYRFTYGMLLANSLAPKAAVIRLREALELFPNSSRLWLALGIAHFKDNMNNEAATAFSRAVELDPKFAPPFAYLGMTYVEIGRYDDAFKSYERALAINEKLGVVDYLVADVMLRQASDDTARIEARLSRAVKLEPSFAPARLALGKLYFRTNRLPEAAVEIEQVVKLDPHLAEAYYQLGRIYARLKRTSEAQATMATFKRLSETQKEEKQSERREVVRRLADVRF